ncbi:hypothetical protein M422DRAFT_271435 [Sphaerobolus stellatus SS14]|uniref:Uncharacterized protein n=1 Tax=Sphaerobolus stellatus (strain SS14) TaxID=990650 RepID=A0A0C9UEF3_SPHS4|nr:hypothetical protein M422DRAFT_271435 [Sphaerobolus stellatus SS14]
MITILAPDHERYSIGQWPLTFGRTTTTHTVYLAEETHFDVILGRSFMEKRGVRTDPLDMTSMARLDTGESLEFDPGWLKYEWNGTTLNLDDDSNYTIFIWRQQQPHSQPSQPSTSSSPISPSPSPALVTPNANSLAILHFKPPTPPAYLNPTFYLFRPSPAQLYTPSSVTLQRTAPPLPAPANSANPKSPQPLNSPIQKGLREIPRVEWCADCYQEGWPREGRKDAAEGGVSACIYGEGVCETAWVCAAGCGGG